MFDVINIDVFVIIYLFGSVSLFFYIHKKKNTKNYSSFQTHDYSVLDSMLFDSVCVSYLY